MMPLGLRIGCYATIFLDVQQLSSSDSGVVSGFVVSDILNVVVLESNDGLTFHVPRRSIVFARQNLAHVKEIV